MAQEKARAPRARTKADGESKAAAEKTTKTARASARKGSSEAGATGAKVTTKRTAKTAKVETATAKAAPAKKAPVAAKAMPARKAPTRRTRTLASVPAPTAESIAERAYLLWERGEPGDQTEHWLRAEAELRAA